MLNHSIWENLQKIPLWLWIILPVLLLGLLGYTVTRNHKSAARILLIGMLAASMTAGYHFWKVYLGNHFVGSFNEYGVPTIFTRSGWPLMLDAWVLWGVPSIFFSILSNLALWQVVRWIQDRRDKALERLKEATPSLPALEMDIQAQLDIQRLKQQLAIVTQKYQEIQDQPYVPAEERNMFEKIKENFEASQQENTTLKEHIQTLTLELDHSKTLIEKLLQESIMGRSKRE